MGANISRPSGLETTREVLDAIRGIVQALRESSRAAERHVGLSGAQAFVLRTLGERTSLSLNDLAAATHTHQSSVSTVVARLVEAGLVRRARSPEDARRLELSLTARGRDVASKAPDAAQQRLIAAINRLPAARRRELAATLRELGESVAAVDRMPPMFFEEVKPLGRRKAARAAGPPAR
jgi:DNA-binding MarR family transcriptional regulator